MLRQRTPVRSPGMKSGAARERRTRPPWRRTRTAPPPLTPAQRPARATTAAVEHKPNSPGSGAPTIGGTAQVGETLSADVSSIADEDGLDNAALTCQWLADDADRSEATNSTYTLADADHRKAIRVRVSFTDDGGNDETLTAATSGISDEDGLSNVSFNYQWLADDADIAGAANATYTLTNADRGKAIKVRVTFTDDAGNAETLTSAATAAVAAAPTPLTAAVLDTPGSHDGQAEFTFELRFSEHIRLSYKKLQDHAFTVTGGDVTNARRLEQGSNVRWEITVKPDGDADVTVALPETTDCNAQGAICTGDGRKLSNRTELTVSGPGQ